MHKIRASAKHSAWWTEDDEPSIWNPFGKLPTNPYATTSTQRRREHHDLEAGPNRASTAPASVLADTGRRRWSSDVEGRDELPSRAQSHSERRGSAHTEPEVLDHRRASGIPGQREADSQGRGDTTSGTLATKQNYGFPDASKYNVPSRKHGGIFGKLHSKRKEEDEVISVSEKSKPKYTAYSQLKYTFFSSYGKIVLYPFIPAGFAVQYTGKDAVTVFAVNFIAIFPTVLVVADAADELMLRTGDNLGALINATFSNAVQLITSIFLLRDNQIKILQITLIGTILSSMHLMLGLSFFFGGWNRVEQHYNITVAQVSSNLLLLAMVGIILPTMGKQLASITSEHVTRLSRGISFILIFVYAVYLFFQLKSHSDMYVEPSQKAKRRNTKVGRGDALKSMVQTGAMMAPPLSEHLSDDDDEDGEVPKLAIYTIVMVLVICTTLIGFNTAFATNSLQGLMDHTSIQPTFVGIVLLPLLSNDVTVVIPAVKDKMDICVALTVGKCLQTILLVIPFAILLGWIIGRDMNLGFDTFEVVALFASVIYINAMIQNGKSTYLDGVLLLSVFLIICLTSYWVPGAGGG